VLGKDVPKVEFGDAFGGDCSSARDEESELGKTFNNY
jgi:hypothetical protein